MIMHRGHKGDRTVREAMPIAGRDEFTLDPAENDELGYIVKMPETSRLRSFGGNRHPLGNHGRS